MGLSTADKIRDIFRVVSIKLISNFKAMKQIYSFMAVLRNP